MARRKKKQRLEPEAGTSQGGKINYRDDSDTSGTSREDTSHLENEGGLSRGLLEVAESGAGQLDLNCHPNDHEDMQEDGQQDSA